MQGIERFGKQTAARADSVLEEASVEPLVVEPPAIECEVCVVVPVRDEAEHLVATLNALAHQIDLHGKPLHHSRYEIILLANNCGDDSAAIARKFAQQNASLALHVVEITLPKSEAYIGKVRRLLMNEAYRRLMSIGRDRGVIASTDGDTRVAPTWIAATLEEITRGADAVGGRIITDRPERSRLDPYARLCHLREVGYRYLLTELETYLDPEPCESWPRHYQHYGASVAVTAQMYARVGGIPAVRTPEDVAFYQALVRVDARFRHSPAVKVITSARQTGRAKNGLANQLREWTAMGHKHQPFIVESVARSEQKLQARRKLRSLWMRSRLHQLSEYEIAQCAQEWGVSLAWLTAELYQSPTFGLLRERVKEKQAIELERDCHQEISQAIADLRSRLSHLRKTPVHLNSLEQVKPILIFPLSVQMPQVRIG
ncbi:glycosyl transferase family 2 [Gloeocapsa sp. PCC 7428]|uniref:glycosyltransferase n=1 Tax=Gloeocapsa sp. PCC 7428 TaxID=1173026 RepID=UPI0002A60FD2|nr:glycosyltransferase [Gloeocapsa sp. PCC 7428]AFZ29339.1 glycosyl transferase family 2 [Gloeocapsa sp. PCC 7428]